MVAEGEVEREKNKLKQEVKIAKQKAKEAKSVGIIEGRIESAYLMVRNAGLSVEAVIAALNLSELEQAIFLQRMAQNGH